MPAHRATATRRTATRAIATVRGETLVQRLFLLRWLHAQFGFPSVPNDPNGDGATKQALEFCRNVQEGYAADGVSYLTMLLLARGGRSVTDDHLRRYDENIRRHLHAINERRAEPITLRYFQHLALLYTEHVLHRLFAQPRQLCSDLNRFVQETRAAGWREFPRFRLADLRKLAYMMATGSGKTLLLHINYRQFLHYNAGRPLANILLVTPNKDLSEQHERELRASGLPCRRFEPGRPRDFTDDPYAVEIIEISRFVPEKRDRGTRVEPASFSGRNLIFVDEGHRSKSEEGVQRRIREALTGDEGFVFEYSATFQQAFAGEDEDQKARRDEYGAAIVFDYSYRWFLHDGFGKDFTVLNSRGDDEESALWPLLAGLFVFGAQVHAYRNNTPILANYNVAHPLALMVGSQVAGSSGEDNRTKSDVLRALLFFHRFLRNADGWSVARLNELLAGTSPLHRQGLGGALKQARDYFDAAGLAAAQLLFDFIAAQVFHSPTGGGLVIHRIKGNENEIALRASEAGGGQPFGLVYIGKASDLTALILPEHGIEQSDDALADAWFPRIEEPDSPVNFLVGAKMFIEGWSSWRVSAMGLVNIGKSEGSEIIQLFGRGVRLLGLHRGLKRSTCISGIPHPKFLPILERLFVFAIDSRYMEKFRQIIDREGVDGGGFVEYELKLWRMIEHGTLPDLAMPEWPGETAFRDRAAVLFDPRHLGDRPDRRRIAVRRDLRYQSFASDDDNAIRAGEAPEREKKLSECGWRRFIDREALYLRLVSHARERGFDNLGFGFGHVRQFIENHADDLILHAPEKFHQIESWDDRRRLEEAVFDLMKVALERVYRRAQQTWETQNMRVPMLSADHPNHKFVYRIRVPQRLTQSAADFIRELEALVGNCPKEDWSRTEPLTAVARFGEHLYQPLLLDAGLAANKTTPNRDQQRQLTIVPALLTESEQQFVEMLRDYWIEKKETEHRGERIFLLRNLSRGKGIGFFESEGFYPDFILWHLLANGRQRLVFIEPHGMRQEDAPDVSKKVKIAREIGAHLDAAIRVAGCPIAEVTAFIVSATPLLELRRKHGENRTAQWYAEHHILFPEEMAKSPRLGGILMSSSGERP